MLVPYGVDNPMRRLPWVNWALIAANLVVYGFQLAADTEVVARGGHFFSVNELVRDFGLVPAHFRWYHLVTYAFLHGGMLHLLGNMLFLWTFGNNVNDKLGHAYYLGAYVAFGVLSGLAHVVSEHGSPFPCVGASGAIFGVMGLYLAFFPLNDVRMFYLLWIRPGTFRCSAYWPIFGYVALNIYWVATGSGGNTAVAAHLGGFAAGFGAGLALLAKDLVPRDDYDFLAWLSGRRQKKLYERFGSRGQAVRPGTGPLPSPPAAAPPRPQAPRSTPSARELEGAAVAQVAEGDVRGVCETYRRFAVLYPRLALGEAVQVDVANLLLRAKQFRLAADAFARLARFYPRHPQAPEALYAAGVLLATKLDQKEKGRRLLEEVLPQLTDPAKARRARQVLEQARGSPDSGGIRLADEDA